MAGALKFLAAIAPWVLRFIGWLKKVAYDQGFADGISWASAQASVEAERRIAAAAAARADADALSAADGVPDPYRRD